MRLSVPPTGARGPEDVTASLFIGDRIAQRGEGTAPVTAISLAAATDAGAAVLHVTLVEKYGTAWGAPVTVTASGTPFDLHLSDLTPVPWGLLPQGYPGDWSYWAPPTRRSGDIRLREVERLQLSARKADALSSVPEGLPAGVVIRGVTLV